MKQLELYDSIEMKLEDSRTIAIDYYISTSLDENEKKVYGITVAKRDCLRNDMEETKGLSYSKKDVESLLYVLKEYQVTPMCLLEIVDDLITERICG